MRVPQVRGCQIALRDTTPALEWKIQPGREPSFDALSAPFAATGESTFGGASIIGVDTAPRRWRRLPRTCHPQRCSQNQPGVAEEDLGIVLPDLAPTALQRCRKPRSLKGKEQGRRSLAAAPRPSVQGQTTQKSPCTPTSLLVILVLYPSVVTMLLYCHSKGVRVKPNIAAVSCDSVVNNGVSQMYHCHRCDSIRVHPDLSLNNVLIVQKSWGKSFSAHPLYTRSDRKSETFWNRPEVDNGENSVLGISVLTEEMELRLWLSSGSRLLLETGRLDNMDAPLAPSAVLRCTPDLWPAISAGTMIFPEGTESPHGRSWKYRPVFLRVRQGRIREMYGHPATPIGEVLPGRPTIPPAKTSLDAGYHSIPEMKCIGGMSQKEEDGTVGRSLKTDGSGRMARNHGIRIPRENRRLTPGRSLKDPWLWRDLPFGYHDLNSLAALLSEQNKLVSFLLGPQIHLFSPHTDSTAIDTLWPGGTTRLFCHYYRGCKTEELTPRAPRVPSLASILFKPTTATLALASSPCHVPRTSPSTEELRPLSLEDMYFFAILYTLLLGFTTTSSTNLIHRSTTIGSLVGLLSVAATDRFTLRNGYGTVEARYHLTAYDCSDPSEVQACTAVSRPATAVPEPPLSERIDLPGSNSCRKRRKGTSLHTVASFLGRTSFTTVECTDTRSWTPCTGLFWSHSG